jgi:hypothetical protein
LLVSFLSSIGKVEGITACELHSERV